MKKLILATVIASTFATSAMAAGLDVANHTNTFDSLSSNTKVLTQAEIKTIKEMNTKFGFFGAKVSEGDTWADVVSKVDATNGVGEHHLYEAYLGSASTYGEYKSRRDELFGEYSNSKVVTGRDLTAYAQMNETQWSNYMSDNGGFGNNFGQSFSADFAKTDVAKQIKEGIEAVNARIGRTDETAPTTVERPNATPEGSTPIGDSMPSRPMPTNDLPQQGADDGIVAPATIIDGAQNSAISQGFTAVSELYTAHDTEIARNTASIDKNTAAIEKNSQRIDFVEREIDRLDTKMDGVMATTQAVTAARPYMFSGQTSAVGVGIGAAGDAEAIAIGYGHRINANWSTNANFSATSGDNSETSIGAGIGYAW